MRLVFDTKGIIPQHGVVNRCVRLSSFIYRVRQEKESARCSKQTRPVVCDGHGRHTTTSLVFAAEDG